MNRKLEKAAVLGAGVMGAQIAAHLANAGLQVILLDIIPTKLTPEEEAKGLTLEQIAVRNRFSTQGIEKIKKMKPAPFFTASIPSRIQVGNLEDHLELLRDVDWIIEAVVENLNLKKTLYEKIESYRKPGSLITSNTSGISLSSLAANRSEDFRSNFLGIHFFNPPRYMHLVEVIRTLDTSPETACFVAGVCDKLLGKGLVYANDTPNFIANRIGIYGVLRAIQTMVDGGYTIPEVDKMTGSIIGRPKSATFRTGDLVGLDVVAMVAKNVYENAPNDENRSSFVMPDFMMEMINRNWLGEKAGQGFYKKSKVENKTEILALDYKTMEYLPQQKPNLPLLETAKNISNLSERLQLLINSKDRVSEFLWPVLSDTLLYTARHVPEIAVDPIQVDRAIRWGFNWEMGPFETWDALGVEALTKRMESEGKSIPPFVADLLRSGQKSFYESSKGITKVFLPSTKEFSEIPERDGVLVLKSLKEREKVIKKNAGASLVDLGDGIACLEFHSKMNTIGSDTISMINSSIKEVDQNFEGLVVSNQGEHFCAGANLMMIMMAAQEEEWDELDLIVRSFQNATMSLRYSNKPVVVAPFGLTLGGGCEITLHGDRVRAAAETYIGLVEVGVGLLPAGGGTKEMLLRATDKAKGSSADTFPFVKEVFTNIATAKVFGSGVEAFESGYLRSVDSITMNSDRLLADAKSVALSLVREGYRKPTPRTDIPVLGTSGFAALKLGAHLMMRAGYASEYDAFIAEKVARILTGGDLNHTTLVSEQYLLDLERECFLSLLGQRKTLERMQSILKTGKPLRN